MSRLIDEERLCQDLDKLYKQAEERKLKDLQKLLLDYITPITVGQPTVEEKKQGKWIEDEFFNGNYYANCSECGYQMDVHNERGYFNYCPNCGAKMEGVIEDIPMEYFESGGK